MKETIFVNCAWILSNSLLIGFAAYRAVKLECALQVESSKCGVNANDKIVDSADRA